jgi:hypothetical protein
VFGRAPGRTLREYGGSESHSILSRSQFVVRRRLPFLFGGASAKQPSVFLVTMGYRATDSKLKTPVLVGTDNRGVTRILSILVSSGHIDDVVRADFMNTQGGVATRHSLG